MKIENETYQCKLAKLKKQYQLYDDFLQDTDTELTFESRSKLIHEMGRIIDIIKGIESMTVLESRKKTDDYPVVVSSMINYHIITLEPEE